MNYLFFSFLSYNSNSFVSSIRHSLWITFHTILNIKFFLVSVSFDRFGSRIEGQSLEGTGVVVIPAHHFQFTVHLTNHFKDTLTQQQTCLWCFQIRRDPYLWRTMLTFKIEWYKGMAPVLSITHKEIPIVILPLELMFRKFQISGIIISNHFPSLVYLHLHWHCKENESQPLKIESKNLFWFYVCF